MSPQQDGTAPACDAYEAGQDRDRPRWRGIAYGTVWLVFLLFPLLDALRSRQPVPVRLLIAAAALVFGGVYMAQLLLGRWIDGRPRVGARAATLMVTTQVAIALTLTVADRPAWAALYIFTVAGSAVVLRGRRRTVAFLLCAILTPLSSIVAGGVAGDVIAYTTTTVGIGMLMLALADLRSRNAELSAARAELARLAVAQERERFGRDLHDLLGHSLLVIALKAELAGRLLPGQPAQAATEISEVEDVARNALAEVREAVSGYRQPTLEVELAGARMALSAAGIEADVQLDHVALAPAIEAVLAWTVREGATNVIRHSRAGICAIRIAANLSHATAEVVDDGLGPAVAAGGPGGHVMAGANAVDPGPGGRGGKPESGERGGNPESSGHGGNPGSSGSGLLGLAARARELGGAVDAGPGTAGGFRLAVRVPVRAS